MSANHAGPGPAKSDLEVHSGEAVAGVAAGRSGDNGAQAVGTQVLERAVALLGTLAREGGRLSPAELADRAAVPPSTTYRLAQGLERHGLVAREGRGAVTLGLRILDFARQVEARVESGLVEPSRAVMQRLARDHGETSLLTAPTGTYAIGLASFESPHPIRLSFERWRVAPMHLGASGKVLLAHLGEPTRSRVVAAARGSRDASGRQVRLDELGDDLAEARRAGYLVTESELDEGALAVAAPLLDDRGRLIAGLSVAGPANRVRGRLDTLIPAVVDGAAEIARRIVDTIPD